MLRSIKGRVFPTAYFWAMLLIPGQALAQRTGENAVAAASDAFGSVVGNEVIGLYTSASARGFNPSQAGNLRIEGLYFDQAGAPSVRIQRGSTIHVGISAQGYPLPAPTGVVDFDLRVPGNRAVTSVQVGHGALFSYPRTSPEVDVQVPVIKDVLSIGAGVGYSRNAAHEVAVRDTGYNGGIIAHWTPTEAISIIPFWSGSKTGADGGDRPRIFIGDNDAPKFRAVDLTSPDWLFFGFRQFNYGVVSQAELPDQWSIKTGIFRSENNTPTRTFTAFVLNTNALGRGNYAIEKSPPRYTHSTSGEVRLSKSFFEAERKHSVYVSLRARDRDSTFGGGDLQRFGTVTLGAFPQLPEPQFQTTSTTLTETRQMTGGVAYEGVWREVGQLSMALQKSKYERTLIRTGAKPVTGRESPLLYNMAGAAYLSSTFAAYAGYTRGFEELGTAPGNAINRDEAVPAALTTQIDAGVRYTVAPNLQMVAGVFRIEKPYYGLDALNVFRKLGTIRHRGVELSLAGPITDQLTVVAGAVLLQPRITNAAAVGGTTSLTAVGPIPRLIRVNFQYRPHIVKGLAFDAKFESISARYLNVSNSRRIPGAITVDAGVRYTTTISNVPIKLRLQGLNLSNTISVTPNASGQINPFEARRVELTLAADF